MLDVKEEIWKLEEVSRGLKEKSQDNTDVDLMSKIQHIQQCIHVAYVTLRQIHSN